MEIQEAQFAYLSKYIGHPCKTFKIGGYTETKVSGATLMCVKRGLFEKQPILKLRSILSVNEQEIRNILNIMGGYTYKVHPIKTLLMKGDSPVSPIEWLRIFIDRTQTEWDLSTKSILMNLSDEKNPVNGFVGNNYWANYVTCNDYLQSIGVITPYWYINNKSDKIELTQSELIKLGWVELLP
jgi:hypothetical protein